MMVLGPKSIPVRLIICLVLVPIVSGHIALAATPEVLGRLIKAGKGVDIGDSVVVGRSPDQA